MSIIFARIITGDIDGYRHLMEVTPINSKSQRGASLLQIAIAYGSEEIAIDLVDRGIEIDNKTPMEVTELQDALVMGFNVLARKLVARGADLFHRESHGNNALWYASTHPRPDYDLVKQLVDAGSDVHTKNRAGRSPLDAAKERGNEKMIEVLER